MLSGLFGLFGFIESVAGARRGGDILIRVGLRLLFVYKLFRRLEHERRLARSLLDRNQPEVVRTCPPVEDVRIAPRVVPVDQRRIVVPGRRPPGFVRTLRGRHYVGLRFKTNAVMCIRNATTAVSHKTFGLPDAVQPGDGKMLGWTLCASRASIGRSFATPKEETWVRYCTTAPRPGGVPVREPKASERAEQRVREDIDRVELSVRKSKLAARTSGDRRPPVKLLSAKPKPTAGRPRPPAIRKKAPRRQA